MKRYSEYKDSGVKWIGEIPGHWKVMRLSQIAYDHFISNKKIHHQNLLSLSYGQIIRKDINGTNGLLPASFDTYQVVEEGNIILRLTDLQNDHKSLRVGLVKETGIITSAYLCLAPQNMVYSKYLYFQLHACDIKKVFYSMGDGLRQSLNFDGMRKLASVIPPLSEQQAIVTYLDTKVAKIDEYISIAEKKISALEELKQTIIAEAVTRGIHKDVPMKYSGVKWIGMIPEHWKVHKIRSHFKERRVKVSDKDFQALSVAKIGIVPQLEDACKTDNGDNRKQVLKGDFVVNSRSDRKGSCGISPLDGSVSLINIVLRPFNILQEYVHYLFRSHNYIEEFYRNGRGIVADLWTTRYSEMRNIQIPVPPLSEQQEIVTYIEAKVANINQLCQAERSQIEKLKEYKQRLISDVVTGKVKVTND